MRHKRFAVDTLVVSGRAVSLRYGDLLVATSEGSPDVEWEVLAASNDEVQLEQAPYGLVIHGAGRDFTGDAILVRSDGLAHVFRGIGPLAGVTEAELA